MPSSPYDRFYCSAFARLSSALSPLLYSAPVLLIILTFPFRLAAVSDFGDSGDVTDEDWEELYMPKLARRHEAQAASNEATSPQRNPMSTLPNRWLIRSTADANSRSSRRVSGLLSDLPLDKIGHGDFGRPELTLCRIKLHVDSSLDLNLAFFVYLFSVCPVPCFSDAYSPELNCRSE
jgi:hypothetical protein